MPTNKNREKHKLYMRKWRRRKREKQLREAYFKRKLQELKPTEKAKSLPKSCQIFRSMLLGEIPLDLTYKHHHMNDCPECYNFFLNRKQTREGVNFW